MEADAEDEASAHSTSLISQNKTWKHDDMEASAHSTSLIYQSKKRKLDDMETSAHSSSLISQSKIRKYEDMGSYAGLLPSFYGDKLGTNASLLPSSSDDNLGYALHKAAEKGNVHKVKLLLKETVNPIFRGCAIGKAAEKGHIEIVKLLLGKTVGALYMGDAIEIAAENGQTEIVKLLLEKNDDPFTVKDALRRAAKNGHIEIVKLLLEKNDDPFTVCNALTLAAEEGNTEIVQFLLQKSDSLTRAAYTGRAEVVKLLLDEGANPNTSCILPVAVYKGHTEIVKLLLDKKADVNKGYPLQRAAEKGHIEIAKLLLEKGSDPNRGNPLGRAVENGHTEIVKLLLEKEADPNNWGNPLGRAVENGHTEIVKLLLEKEADPNNWGNPLERAAENEHTEIVKLLLEKEADPNKWGNPLGRAAENGHTEIVKLLLEKEADPNKLRYSLESAAENGHTEIVKLLLEKEADPNKWGNPLGRAAEKGHTEIVKLLLEKVADPNNWVELLGRAVDNGHTEIVKVLLEKGANPNRGDPLGRAAEKGHTEIVKVLLEKGANPNRGDPLGRAAEKGHTDIVKLLQHGVNPSRTEAFDKVDMFSKDHTSMLSDDPAQTSLMSDNPSKTSIISDDPAQILVMSDDPAQTSLMSDDPAQILVMSDDPAQTSLMSDGPAQTSLKSDYQVKTSGMSDNPAQTSLILDNPAQTSIMSDNPVQTSLMSNDPIKTSRMSKDPVKTSVMSDDPDSSLDHDLQWVIRIVKKRDMKTFETFEKSPPLGMFFARILQIVAVCGSPEMVECMAKWQETEWDTDCEICELLLVEELKGLEVKTATALYLAAFLDRTEMVCSLVTYSSEKNMGFCFRTLKLSEPTEKVFMMDLAEKIKLKHFDIQPATVIPGHRMDKSRGRTRVYIVYSVLVVKASTYELEDLGHVMLVNPYKITQEVDDDARERMSVSNEETNRAQKALSKHRQKLWTEHSNLNIIRIARFKHQNHGKGIIEKTCIELFCSTKGVVPLGEQEFPKRLDIGNGDFLDVNVREGYFRYGAYDTLPSSSYHLTLKMGCNVGRSTPEYDQGHILQSVGGTLGPFVRYGSKIGFLSCAHVFFNIKNPAQPLDYYSNGRDEIKVVQPSLDTPGNHGIPCGYVHRAIFNPQLNPSVDVTVVELMNRIPNHGQFANNSSNSYKKAGFDELPEFNTGWLETNVRNIAASQTVFKFGSVSDVTRGVLDVSGCDVRPLSTILGLPRNTGAAHMINQYQVFGVYPSLSFFLEGDSGSAVFMKEPVRGELVYIGMAIGHTNVDINKFPSTVVTPIGAILNALGPQYTLASFP